MKKIFPIILVIFCLAPQLKAGKTRQKQKPQMMPKIQIKVTTQKGAGKQKTRKQKKISDAQKTVEILRGLIESGQTLPNINPTLLRKIATELGNLATLAIERNNFAAADQLSTLASSHIMQTTSQEATMGDLSAQIAVLNMQPSSSAMQTE